MLAYAQRASSLRAALEMRRSSVTPQAGNVTKYIRILFGGRVPLHHCCRRPAFKKTSCRKGRHCVWTRDSHIICIDHHLLQKSSQKLKIICPHISAILNLTRSGTLEESKSKILNIFSVYVFFYVTNIQEFRDLTLI